MTQYLSVAQIFETDRFLMIRYFYKEKKDFLLVEKENRKSYLVNWEFNGNSGLLNDLDDGPSFVPKIYFKENGMEYIAGLINSIQFKTIISSDEFIKTVPKYPEKKKGGTLAALRGVPLKNGVRELAFRIHHHGSRQCVQYTDCIRRIVGRIRNRRSVTVAQSEGVRLNQAAPLTGYQQQAVLRGIILVSAACQ